MTLVEPQTILSKHVQLPPKRAPRFAVYRVCMACCMDIGPRFMDRRMNCESCSVDRFVAFDYFTGFGYED
jgi:hypothetical protein